MAQNVINEFSQFDLTPDEDIQAQLLSPETVMRLHNGMYHIATQRLNLDVNVSNVLEFAQQEAFLKGQLAVYRYLLDCNDQAREVLSKSITPQQ